MSVLEERLLTLPKRRDHGDGYIEVHPDFRAVFTSNPEEYAGVHRTQDALMDRLITIARVAVQQGAHARLGDPIFLELCRDVLGGLSAKIVRDGTKGIQVTVDDVVMKHLKDREGRRAQKDNDVAVDSTMQAVRSVVERGA